MKTIIITHEHRRGTNNNVVLVSDEVYDKLLDDEFLIKKLEIDFDDSEGSGEFFYWEVVEPITLTE